MRLKLSLDEQEALIGLKQSELYDILKKVCGHLAGRIDEQVLLYDLNRGPEGLVIAKARSEGARVLERELLKVIEDVAKKQT